MRKRTMRGSGKSSSMRRSLGTIGRSGISLGPRSSGSRTSRVGPRPASHSPHLHRSPPPYGQKSPRSQAPIKKNTRTAGKSKRKFNIANSPDTQFLRGVVRDNEFFILVKLRNGTPYLRRITNITPDQFRGETDQEKLNKLGRKHFNREYPSTKLVQNLTTFSKLNPRTYLF